MQQSILNFMRKYKQKLLIFILIIFSLFLFAAFEEPLITSLGLKNTYSNFFVSSPSLPTTSIAQPITYYQTERSVNIALISQNPQSQLLQNESSTTAKILTKSEQTSFNYQKALLSLLNNLKDQKQYDSITLLIDPTNVTSLKDISLQQLQKSFPNISNIYIPDLLNLKEDQILANIEKDNGQTPLIILHTFLPFSTDELLDEQQNLHLKDVFDQPTKKKLTNLPFTNQEALKAVYQYAKNHQLLKILPSFEDPNHAFNIRYFTEGIPMPTKTATITFFGDIMLGRNVRQLMDNNTLDYAFLKMDPSYLRFNDLLVANLEGPIVEKVVKTSKSIAFHFAPDTAQLLAKHSFDLVSTANNHTLDMSQDGLIANRNILNSVGIIPFGDPKTINEFSVSKQTINGLKFAFLGLNDTDFKLDYKLAIETVRDLHNQGYLVIPFLHWGLEYQHNPTKQQIEFAHQLVDAGAVTIIGAHPHVVESFEIYNNVPIFYSLGNAIFDQYFSPDTQEGLSTTLHFAPNQLTIYFNPINIDHSQFSLILSDLKANFLKKFTTYWRYDQTIKDQIEKGKIVLNFNMD